MHVKEKIERLAKEGFTVDVRHGRLGRLHPALLERASGEEPPMLNVETWTVQELRERFGWAPHPRGGRTEVSITNTETGEQVAFHIALCNPIDNYNKKLGVQIALGRALAQPQKPSLFEAFRLSSN